MLFPTVAFAAFFAPVFALSWLLMPYPRAWKPFIVAASYVFYAAADWRFCLLLAAVTLANQAAAQHPPHPRRALQDGDRGGGGGLRPRPAGDVQVLRVLRHQRQFAAR